MKKLEKTKFFVIAIFALAILLASCDNTAGGSSSGDSPKSVLDTPQNALRNIPLTGELINQALGKTPSSPSLRSASAFDDVKDGLEDYMLSTPLNQTELTMAILKFDFSKMDLRFGDIYRIPNNFDFSQETRNYLHNYHGEEGDAWLGNINFFRNAFFQIVKYSPTIVYCYFKPNGSNSPALVKLSENITGILDTEFFLIDYGRNQCMYERTIESNRKKIGDYQYHSDGEESGFSKTIIDNSNSYYSQYNYGVGSRGYAFNFRNKYVYGGSYPSSAYYATSDGKTVRKEDRENKYFLKYLTPIKTGLKLDGDTWKWGDGTEATEIKFTEEDGKKCYYVEEADLAGKFSVPASTKNIITTLDAKIAEMETEAKAQGFFITEIPNEADWKKRLDDWLATL